MITTKSTAFVDEAETLLAAIRGGVLVHLQDGVHPNHLRAPLEAARSLNHGASQTGDEKLVEAAATLEAWLTLLAAESDPLSPTRTSSLLDQISEFEVALIAFRSSLDTSSDMIATLVDESLDDLNLFKDRTSDTEVTSDRDAEFDAEMMEVFREEADSLLQNIQVNLRVLAARPNDVEALWEIKRSAHTFKGAAGIVGLKESSELAHRIEDLLARLSPKDTNPVHEIFELLNSAAECLTELTNGGSSSGLGSRIEALNKRFGEVLNAINDLGPAPQSLGNAQPSAQDRRESHTSNSKRGTPAPKKSSVVRVSLDRLDELVDDVRDLVQSRSAFEEHIDIFTRQLEEAGNNTLRLLAASGKIEGFDSSPSDPAFPDQLELERHLAFRQTAYELVETARDAVAIDNELGHVKSTFGSLYDQQEGLMTRIREGVMRLRNVEFGTIVTRLQRTVRVTCDEEGKDADVVIENGSMEIDTQLIDAVIEPLMHLLKNAVVHGIESAETRRMLGKPEAGKITIAVGSDDTTIKLTVTDDGCGISFRPLMDKAVALGLISQVDADEMTGVEMRELIFLPGLTTAEKLSLNAGRGVGMSIVRESVAAIGGSVSVATYPQKGTTFTLTVPRPFAEIKTNTPMPVASVPAVVIDRSAVLIVDDSPSVRMMTSKTLEAAGWRAETANNGVDALERLRTSDVRPCLIVSDIEMPKMGGYELLAAVREDESLKSIPVIFVSSRSAASNRDKAMKAGAAEYLTKPYRSSDLTAIVERLAVHEARGIVE